MSVPTRIQRLTLMSVVVGVVAGCGNGNGGRNDGGPATDGGDASGDGTPLHGYELPGFPNGFEFNSRLPPTFSPFFPYTGEVSTREPPEAEFYEPSSDHFFSYGFIWWLTGMPDLSTAALRSALQVYYIGLCPSPTVTVNLGEPEGDSPGATTGSGRLVARRTGTLEVTTCFEKPVPAASIEVWTYDCPDHAAVVTLVSPQPNGGSVWTELRTIRDGFSCW